MGVRVRIPPFFQQFTGGQKIIETRGHTVGECLEDLARKFPEIKQRLYDKRGKLAPYIEIYVNSETSYPEELAKSVKEGDELTIVVALSGG